MDEAPLVLLVEDDSGVRAVMAAVLGHVGYRVALAEGPAALVDAARLQPDLILLDLYMPRLGGETIYRALQADPVTRAIPIVLASAVDDLPSVARKLGAASYLMKPYDMQMLQDKIDPLIAAYRASRSQGGNT